MDVGGIIHWLGRTFDNHGAVSDIFLQNHRAPGAARLFFRQLPGENDVPEVVHIDQLGSHAIALNTSPPTPQREARWSHLNGSP
ncbi:DDE-type integrase/transposase/recombinase [Deinococcus humi]|uniref:DDE-type integrase/transposase/recombinase n=1 Tax=Deinococcus humi TaxID=662880 RepID=UPI00160FEC82